MVAVAVADGVEEGVAGVGAALEGEGAGGPGACRAVFGEEEDADDCDCGEDEGDDEGDAPGDVVGEMLVVHEGVEEGWHHEVGYPASCIAESSCQGVGGADYAFVEEGGRPYYAGDEAAADYADEEAEDTEACCVVDGPSQCDWDCACCEEACHCPSRSYPITRCTCSQSGEEAIHVSPCLEREMFGLAHVATSEMILEFAISA